MGMHNIMENDVEQVEAASLQILFDKFVSDQEAQRPVLQLAISGLNWLSNHKNNNSGQQRYPEELISENGW